ncbi:BppU family phage baseplate upper protein [Ligilactobacillus salivarius]|uniref:BppU family phage baseplate upper protein n=1 Tax=Ligilactobacillus salivarius TaxID=1624 RepID=UPI000BAFF5A0|nr:BppU family phage baseplate upper protein [Ligilactobacillus salivarius]PAY27732.1 hypothetical protein A8C44_11210 [Ligilactobacillus salivarius]
MAVANNQYINFDLLRYQNEVLDITNKFKGRVGDTQDYIKLFVTSNSYPVDLRGMKLLFGGVDPNQQAHRHYLDFRADQKTDNLEQGRCTVYFDENTFNYKGTWEQAYFKFIDANGNTVSTVDMVLVVLQDRFYAAVGQTANIAIDEFEKEYEKVREAERNLSMISADSLEDIMYGYSIKIVHNQKYYPKPTVFYYENALGTETGGLGSGSFGETLTKLVPCEAEYTDNNSIIIRIPRNFYMNAKPYYKYGDWYLISGNKTIKISLGNVDDSAAKTGDSKGSSYLSNTTGYFNYPTAPSDLRAVYVNDTTERLEWR